MCSWMEIIDGLAKELDLLGLANGLAGAQSIC